MSTRESEHIIYATLYFHERRKLMKTKKLLTWVAASTLMLAGLAGCADAKATDANVKAGSLLVPQAGQPAAGETEPAPVTLSGIEVTKLPDVDYVVGDLFNAAGLEVTATYSDKSERALEADEFTMSLEDGYEFTAEDVGRQLVTVTYEEKHAYFTVSVEELAVVELRVGGQYKAVYRLNEEFEEDGLVVTAVMNNGEEVEVTNYSLRVPSFSSYGEKEIYVTYGGVRTSFTVEVREDRWYEIIGEYLEELGIDFDLPTEALLSLSEEVFEEGELTLIESSSGEYLQVSFPYLNQAVSSYVALMACIDYAMNPTNFALIEVNYDDFDWDTYSGYFYWEVYSEISSTGLYVDLFCDGIDGYSSYGYEDEFRLLFFVNEAATAEETAEALNAALYGEDSIVNLPDVSKYGLEPVDADALEEISEYYILSGEVDLSNRAMEEMEDLVDTMLELTNGEDYSDYAYYYDCDAIVEAELDPQVYTAESLMNVLTTVFAVDYGFEFYYKPVENDGDYYAVMANADRSIFFELDTFHYEDEDEECIVADFFVWYGESAYTTFTDLTVMLPGANAKEELLEAFSDILFEKYTEWEAMFGDLAVSVLDNEGVACYAQLMGYGIEAYGEQQNYTTINLFPYYQIYETEDVIEEGANTFLAFFGFETELPDFSEAMPFTTFTGSVASRSCRFMIFDNHDPMYDPYYDVDETYDDDALEDLVLAYFLENEDWELDYSQYDTLGYIAYSKEAFEILPGEGLSQIRVNFYTYQYQFYLTVSLVPVTSVLPVEELAASVDAFYGKEGTAEILGLEDLATALGGQRFIVTHTEEEGHEVWDFYTEEISDAAYDALIAYATALYNSEDWTANITSAPSSSYCTKELVFTHKETGLVVKIYYDYDIDWSSWSLVYFGWITFEMSSEVEPEAPLVFSEVLAEAQEVAQLDSLGFDPTTFDGIAHTQIEVEVYTETTYPYTAVTYELDAANATDEEKTAFYNALTAIVEAAEADIEANGANSRWKYSGTNWNDTDTPLAEGQHSYYCTLKYYLEDLSDYMVYVQLRWSKEYGTRITVVVYGDFEAEPVPAAEGSLQSAFEEYVGPWCELVEIADADDFDGSSCVFTFETLELEEEWSYLDYDFGYGMLSIQTVAYSQYQLLVLSQSIDDELDEAGLELVDVASSQDGLTVRYIYVLENEENGAWIQVEVYYTYNPQEGTYTVRLDFYVLYGF